METMARRVTRKGHTPEQLDLSGVTDPAERRRRTYQHFLTAYMRTIAGVDDNVGRLLRYVDEAGLAENTVVIYTSDQGYFLGEHNYMDKRWIFEESLQMPMIVRYPPEIEPGTVGGDIIINTDFAPLFLDYAALPVPPDMQGRSFRANLRGRSPGDWRESMYYHYWTQQELRPAHYGVRTKQHKLIHFYGNAASGGEKPDAWELYDLAKDPRETANVYGDPAYADVVEQLEREVKRLRSGLSDRRPLPVR